MEQNKIALNTSFHVDSSVDAEFFHWLRHDFTPSLVAGGEWTVTALSRLLMTVEEGLTSYSLRVEAPAGVSADEAIARWEDALAAIKTGPVARHIGHRLLFFTTPMEDFPL